MTHAFFQDSLAVDAGDPAGCVGVLDLIDPISQERLLTDQWGFNRHEDGDGNSSIICDIGAFEYPNAPMGNEIFMNGFA